MIDTRSDARKQVDLLITGAQIVCFDDADTILEDRALAVTGNSIAWLGKASDAAAILTAHETLHAPDTIAMPGLIDCHVHTAQQFLHGSCRPFSGAANCAIPCGSDT